jgi:hypothetical protein
MRQAARRRRTRRETPSASVHVRPVAAALPAPVQAALASPGEPLDVALRAEMEQRLGHDFGDVRVHADARAAAAARMLDADAFTSGADIVFGAGRYRPGAEDGRRLIAHELVHTLQQRRGAPVPSLQVSTPDTDPLEHEAAEVAARVMAGEPVPRGAVTVAAPAARGRIARQARAALERRPAEVPDSPEAVGAVAGDIARLLAFDPADDAGRVKRRLARFAPATRAAVATELGGSIPAPAAARLREILAELLPPGAAMPATEPASEEPSPADSEGRGTETAEPSVAAETADTKEPSAAAEAAGPSSPEPAGPSAPEPAVPDEIPAPEDEAEGPVATPAVEAEAPAEPEGEPVAGEAPQEERRDRGGAAPAAATAEAADPDEEAADAGPVEDTETEALEAHDEADADTEAPGDEPPAGVSEPAPADPGAAFATDEESEVTPEDDAEESGDPTAPVADEDSPVAPTPEAEAEPEETETVLDKPPEEPVPGDEQAVAEPTPADELAGAEIPGAEGGAAREGEEEAEPEEAADATLAEEEPAADEPPAPAAGGDGEGVPIEEPAEPDAPDLSAADPAAAMEAAGNLPPAQSEAALTGVDAAASRSVGAQRATLAEQPPELDRPTGAPSVAELEAESAAAAPPTEAPEHLERAPALPPPGPSRLTPLPAVPPPAAGRAQAPQIQGGPQGELSEDGRKALRASLSALPVHDAALDVAAGPAPAVALEGAADPQQAHGERAKLEDAARGALADGRRAIAQPAGEQHLVPDVPAERLRAAIAPVGPAASATTPAPPSALPSVAGDAASIIARQQRGAELRAAATQAAAGMRTKRAEQAATAADERQRAQQQVTQLVRDSADAQAAKRRDARGEVHDQRRSWSAAEHDLAEGELTRADSKLKAGLEDVTRLKTDADHKAAAHVDKGERDADQARREAEQKAAAERKRGEEKTSDGVIGWLADQANALFDEIKAGINTIFEKARAAVRDAIEGAKRLAAEAIDFARSAIVDAIRLVGDALIAIGDKLLAGFPGVRDRFRRAIEERVAKAQKVVNDLAEGLKTFVQAALDGLGAALDAALGLLEKGLLAVVEGYRAAVAGALKFANSLIQGFAAFAVLVRHVAANPMQWLRNLAISAKDGVRNHLWKAFKIAIKRWFWDKVEEVLGLGLTIWNLLKKGGVSLARIGTMAWEGIKAAIPPTLIQILIEKLISLLIPAAAAVMLIIETLQAAWGTIQRVLEAFERFFAFLKAVRTGKAGPLFANAIAAAAIAVIDFVANWLLKRLRKPAGKIAKKLKALAKKLGNKLARLGKGLFKKRRKKPKLKGKPKKKPKPDKRANAEKRVAAATDFIGRQLDRGMPEPILWIQMQAARVRWRVRVSFRARADTGTLTVSGSPLKKTKARKKPAKDDYVARVERYQGYLREHHHRHHILTNALSPWWRPVKLDWNDPARFLEVPSLLHLRGLHASWKKINAKAARSATKIWKKKLHDTWNVVWVEWLTRRLSTWRITPETLTGYRAAVGNDPKLLARIAKAIDGPGAKHVMREVGKLVGIRRLARFHVKEKGSAEAKKEQDKYKAQLADLKRKLAGVKNANKRKAIIAKWQASVVGRFRKTAKAIWHRVRN